MEKLGEIRKNWQERYFVLFNNGNLSYFKGPKYVRGGSTGLEDLTKAECKGTLNIKSCRFKTPKGPRGHDYMIEFELADRDFQVSFRTKDLMTGWKDALVETGSEHYDPLNPTTKSVYELKQTEKKKEKAIVDRSSSFLTKKKKKKNQLYKNNHKFKNNLFQLIKLQYLVLQY